MIAINPIGAVRNGVSDPRPQGWESVESRIELDPSLASGLEGVEGFSHLLVVFWMDRVPPALRGPRPAQSGLPPVGAFATRTQLRPNPIGVSVVELLGREGAALRVRGLDAVDGTPVLDLKPYLPPYDARPEARMPSWVYG